MWSHLRNWLVVRRQRRAAQRLLTKLFRSPELLQGTSLSARHASRWVYIAHEVDRELRVSHIRFGILRHPRPYAFSRQSHKVIEYYVYHVLEGRLEREKGVNVTRRAGRDAD